MKQIILSIAIAVTGIITAQNVNILDTNFKNYLLANTEINTNGDNEISVAEAEAFTGTIDCSGLNIHDLTGIEAFVNLQGLDCYNNQLTSLGISQNVNLSVLNCSKNNLSSLDVSQNTVLKMLFCYYNNLFYLDVSQNTLLEILECYCNNLSYLNVSKNPRLEILYCVDNQLIALNLKGTSLANGDFYAIRNPDLNCIEVDSLADIPSSWLKEIDNPSAFSEDCY